MNATIAVGETRIVRDASYAASVACRADVFEVSKWLFSIWRFVWLAHRAMREYSD